MTLKQEIIAELKHRIECQKMLVIPQGKEEFISGKMQALIDVISYIRSIPSNKWK